MRLGCRPIACASALFLLAACELPRPEPEQKPDAGCADVEIEGNGRDDDCDASTFDFVRLELPPTDASVTFEAPVEASGAGTDRVGAVALSSSVGTLSIDGDELSAFVDDTIEWPEFDYTLHQLVAIGAGRFVTAWLYCEGDALSWIYFGDADGAPLDDEAAEGTCALASQPASAQVTLPALDLSLPPLLADYGVEGDDIVFDGAMPGTVELVGASWVLWPFRLVDCATGCGEPGWFELHGFVMHAPTSRAAFSILYFYLDPTLPRGSDVALVVGRTLPDASDAVRGDWFFAADFSVPVN